MNASAAERDSLRLFLALWPDAHTRQHLQTWQTAQSWPKEARLTTPADLHLTLHFLGQVPQQRLADILQALPQPSAHAIDLYLSPLQVWPNGVAVLTPETAPDSLLLLHQQLASTLSELDLPPEVRPYRPHVTLARRAHGLTPTQLAPIHWHTQSYVLALSDRGYHRLQHYR